MFSKDDRKLKISADYRVNQPIENFKIRIKIVQQKSPLASLFESEDELRDTNFLECEEMTFKWQEKVFSLSEINFYSDEKNCMNKIHKNYHKKISEEDIKGNRLFSYIHEDSYFYDKNPVTKIGYKSYLSLKNDLAIPVIHNKKPFSKRYNKKVIDLNPTDLQILSNHYLHKDKKIMHIMVDLSSKDEAFNDPETLEVLLCTVICDKTGKVLTIDPDFNNDKCYVIEKAGICYDYWIEHVSRYPTDEDMQIHQDLLRHEIQENVINRELIIFPEIDMPPLNILRLFLTFDFNEARCFPYDAIFLTYSIDLPKYWSTNQRENLSGRSQRCRMVNGHAHFSHTAEISLDFDLNCLDDENVSPSWPSLLIAVASLDKWTRYRIEGYTSVLIPPSSGTYEFNLSTWRPVAGFINYLRRFFTGGTAELETIKYCGIPQNQQEQVIDKTELKSIPSGTVTLRMNIIHQSQRFAKDFILHKYVSNRRNRDELLNSVELVLEQFRAAKERMIKVRNMHT